MTITPRPRPRLRTRLKLRHLILLEALAQENSLHGAANRLHMTQPNATRLLAELEDLLGGKLFERSAKGLIATQYGDAMTRHARVLLSAVDVAEDTMSALLDGTDGLVRIGAMSSTTPWLLANALTTTIKNSVTANVSIIEGAHDMLADRLRHGELDLVVGRVRPDTPLEGLQVRVLIQEEFSVVAGCRHPAGLRPGLTYAEAVDCTWVLPPTKVLVRQEFDAFLTRMCGTAPSRIVESVSLFMNIYLLRNDALLGIMPSTVAQDMQSAGLLRVLPLDLRGIVSPVVLLVREGGILTRAADMVIAALIAVAAGSGSHDGDASDWTRGARQSG